MAEKKTAYATVRMPQTADARIQLMNWKSAQVFKIFTELPIHAQLNTKYCKMHEVEFDFYTTKCVQWEETPCGASADQDNGHSPRYYGAEYG